MYSSCTFWSTYLYLHILRHILRIGLEYTIGNGCVHLNSTQPRIEQSHPRRAEAATNKHHSLGRNDGNSSPQPPQRPPPVLPQKNPPKTSVSRCPLHPIPSHSISIPRPWPWRWRAHTSPCTCPPGRRHRHSPEPPPPASPKPSSPLPPICVCAHSGRHSSPTAASLHRRGLRGEPRIAVVLVFL
jgi:hypothetical protein